MIEVGQWHKGVEPYLESGQIIVRRTTSLTSERDHKTTIVVEDHRRKYLFFNVSRRATKFIEQIEE
jgi:hypothetical protein